MDGTRFDRFATAVGILRSRRAMLALPGALAASAGLPGHYQPWLSDGNITPAGTVLLAAGPSTRFTLVDGTPVANSRAELASGTLRHAINLTESGAAGTSNPGQVWTNALPSGEAAGTASGHCAGWTSGAGGSGNTGEATSATQSWTTGTSAACSEYRRLYCFQFA